MKSAAALVLVVAAAAVAAGCASSYQQPGTVSQATPTTHAKGGPPLVLLNRVRAQIAAARASNPQLFAIFPRLPGSRRCVIPVSEGMRQSTVRGTCRTHVTQMTHGRVEAVVSFREDGGRHHTTWTVIEQRPAGRIVTTHVSGAPAPQYRYSMDQVVRRSRLLAAG